MSDHDDGDHGHHGGAMVPYDPHGGTRGGQQKGKAAMRTRPLSLKQAAALSAAGWVGKRLATRITPIFLVLLFLIGMPLALILDYAAILAIGTGLLIITYAVNRHVSSNEKVARQWAARMTGLVGSGVVWVLSWHAEHAAGMAVLTEPMLLIFWLYGCLAWSWLYLSKFVGTKRTWERAQSDFAPIAAGIGLAGARMVKRIKTPLGDKLIVDVRGTGQSASSVIKSGNVAEQLAAHHGLAPGMATATPSATHAGYIEVSTWSKNPWAKPIPHPGFPDFARKRRNFFGAIPVGLDPETGKDLTITLANEEGGVMWIMVAGTRGGKALELSTPIPTPSGWTTMGEIEDGDLIFDETGSVRTVIHAHDVMHGRPCYEVEFDDGSVIVADGEHLWTTSTRAQRIAATPGRAVPPVTTEHIAATLRTATGHANHAVIVAEPLQYPAADLPLDPYLFGCWLGDGTTAGASITSADQEILDAFTSASHPVTPRAKIHYGIGGGFQAGLRAAGMTLKPGSKHIPEAYLRASVEQRRALLAGLLDTDGHCNGRGQVEFAVTCKALADGYLDLVLGLGYKATMTSRTVRATNGAPGNESIAYGVKFTPGEHSPFRMARKVAAHRPPTARTEARQRYIAAVRPVPSVPVRCLTVSGPSKLYLAGRSCIPTHNTNLLNNVVEHLTDCVDAQGRPLVKLTLIDILKGQKDAINWSPAVHRVFPGPGAVHGALASLQRSADLISARAEANGRRGRSKHVPTADEPADVTIIDEASFLLTKRSTEGRRAIELVQTILKAGASELVLLIIATQRATLDHLGTSDVKANAFGMVVLPVRKPIEQTNIISDWRERGMPDMSTFGGGAKGTALIVLNNDWAAGRIHELHDMMMVRKIALSRVLPEHAASVAEQMAQLAPEVRAAMGADPLLSEPPADGFDDADEPDMFDAPFEEPAIVDPVDAEAEAMIAEAVAAGEIDGDEPDGRPDAPRTEGMDAVDSMQVNVDRMLDVTEWAASKEAAREPHLAAELARRARASAAREDAGAAIPDAALACLVALTESRGDAGFNLRDAQQALAVTGVHLDRPASYYLRILTNQGHLEVASGRPTHGNAVWRLGPLHRKAAAR